MSIELIYSEPPEVEIVPGCKLKAWKTGDPGRRGEVTIEVEDSESSVLKSYTPDQARRLAEKLLALASIAERLSTRGFVGSKE